MNIIKTYFKLLPLIIILISCGSSGRNNSTVVTIKTTLGDIKLKLYDGTPIHRDNFIKLVNSGFYDGISFHRIIKDFMIQAGDPLTKTIPIVNISDSLQSFTIPAEINPLYFHKKGALAAARQGNEVNPEMRSSGTQFYIVQGVKITDEELNNAELRINNNIKQSLFNKQLKQTADSLRHSGKTTTPGEIQQIASVKIFQFLSSSPPYKISESQRQIYKTLGGTPGLDATYTVFGEVIEGLDIVDKIAAVSTDIKDKPLNDVKILKIVISGK